MSKRACGECAACCFFPAVPILGKLPFVLCQHSKKSGCEIYAQRPQECQDYECLWLSSELGEVTDRPDQIGVVFDRPSLVANHEDYQGVDFVCARELHENARFGLRAAELIRLFSRTWVVRLTGVDGRTRLTGPAHLIQLLQQRAAARAGS